MIDAPFYNHIGILCKRLIMKNLLLLVTACFLINKSPCQIFPKPCTFNPVYRQFDFWIGDWDVFNSNGDPAGESHIELLLDSCVILENWKSSKFNYAGKSFNTYNSQLNKWQQTWVDDKGILTEYFGGLEGTIMILTTQPYPFNKDTLAIKKMSFYHLSANKVRQLGEISKDNGNTWHTEFDLEYRRKK